MKNLTPAFLALSLFTAVAAHADEMIALKDTTLQRVRYYCTFLNFNLNGMDIKAIQILDLVKLPTNDSRPPVLDTLASFTAESTLLGTGVIDVKAKAIESKNPDFTQALALSNGMTFYFSYSSSNTVSGQLVGKDGRKVAGSDSCVTLVHP